MSRFMPLARSVLSSPAWFVPFDEYALRVRAAGVTARLDRWDDGIWVPQDTLAVRTPSGALAYPALGRRAEPLVAQPVRHRARFSAPGYEPLYPADDQPFDADVTGVEFLVYPNNDDHPPAVRTEPRVVRMLPGAGFPYPPGTRTVQGVVVDAATGAPAVNVLVEAEGQTSLEAEPWHERTLSDIRGAFRLSLRWEGEKTGGGTTGQPLVETFRLRATQRPGRTGSLVVRAPEELGRRQVIEIREQ